MIPDHKTDKFSNGTCFVSSELESLVERPCLEEEEEEQEKRIQILFEAHTAGEAGIV